MLRQDIHPCASFISESQLHFFGRPQVRLYGSCKTTPLWSSPISQTNPSIVVNWQWKVFTTLITPTHTLPRLHWPMEASSRPQNILRLQLKTASKRCRPQRRLSGLSFFADQCQRAGMIITPKWCLPGEVDFSLLQRRMAHKGRLQPQLLENISLIPPLTKGDN